MATVVETKKTETTSQVWAIDVHGLTKSFGNHPALNGVELRVKKGEFFTILGPNGAGKSTLIKVLATLLKPSAGSVQVAGLDIRDNPTKVRREIGVVTHQTFLYDTLTAFENLKFYGKMYDIPNLEERISEVVIKVGLVSYLHHQVRTLSRGRQQRLSIARAILHSPSIMLLDEPDTGLDQQAISMLGEMLDTFSAGERTVVMTTHNIERGLELGDQVAILAEGKVVYVESTRSLNIASLREMYHYYTANRQ